MNLIFSNGFVPILPILLWNIVFASKLPSEFQPKTFHSDLPVFIVVGERMFRIIIFAMPLFLKINIFTDTGRSGLLIYLIGVFLYFASWLFLMFVPISLWSKNILVFTAPAYTPIVWLFGLGLMYDSYYFDASYNPFHYFVPTFLFVLFHTIHVVIVYNRIQPKRFKNV
jgi:hypothetical protein